MNPMYPAPFAFIGTFAIWECNHCTERRVYGNAPPDPDSRVALIRCQATSKNELHTFKGLEGQWAGKECPLPTFPIGGLPCNGSKACACGD